MSDPRAHPQAHILDGDRIEYRCGCVNEIQDSGVLRSVSKCRSHSRERRHPASAGMGYYRDLGCIVNGVPQCAHYLEELREVLGPFPKADASGIALEVGCGCSMYAPGLMAAGYLYHAVEPSEWAAHWTASTFDVPVTVGTLEARGEPMQQYALVLAAHSIEHMEDAPRAIRDCAEFLLPGGELWVIIPNDDDPLNPDHLFFFTQSSLRRCVESAGLEVITLESRRRVKHEEFLYLRARKP